MARGYFFSFKKRHGSRSFLWALLIFTLILLTLFGASKVSDVRAEKHMAVIIEKAVASLEEEAEKINADCKLKEPLNSKSYILIWLSSFNRKFEDSSEWVDLTSEQQYESAWRHNRILLSERANKKIYPASMAKIITALVIIENTKNFDKKITIQAEDFNRFYFEGASIAGFSSGDTLTVRDLLYGLLIASGSECTSALAREVMGGEDNLVDKMNDKAEEIGMNKTHFTNPIGLHDKKNYSTVTDLALALDYAMRDIDFYSIITTQEYRTEAIDSAPKGLDVTSTLMQKKGLKFEFPDGDILGGKTGYTSAAGQCLASSFIKGGEQFILVTAAAMPDNFRTQTLHIDDMLAVFDSVTVK